jgi:hypothetical protein
MTIDAERLAENFTAALAEPAPPSTVDVARLLKDGHRAVRRRRAGAALTALAAAGLCGALAFAVLPAQPTDLAQPASEPHTSRGMDPLTMNGTFGWLPPGFSRVGNEFNSQPGSPAFDQAQATSTTPNKVLGPANVTLLTRVMPGDSLLGSTDKKRIGDINGHPAYWKAGEIALSNGALPADLGGGLVFQSPSGQWAELLGSDVNEADMVRIARTAVLTPKVIPMPIRITGLILLAG